MKSSAYWQRRFEELEAALLKKGERYNADEVERQFRLTLAEIEKEIARWYKRFRGSALRCSFAYGKKLLQKSYPLILSGMMFAIYSQVDKLMLKNLAGEAETGYYAIACSFCTMYRDEKFGIETLEQIESDLKEAAYYYPDTASPSASSPLCTVCPVPCAR